MGTIPTAKTLPLLGVPPDVAVPCLFNPLAFRPTEVLVKLKLGVGGHFLVPESEPAGLSLLV